MTDVLSIKEVIQLVKASELTDIELLRKARPFLAARVYRSMYVAGFRARVRRYFRQGLSPDEVAEKFGLGSPSALRYNTDRAGCDFAKDGDTWELRNRETAGDTDTEAAA